MTTQFDPLGHVKAHQYPPCMLQVAFMEVLASAGSDKHADVGKRERDALASRFFQGMPSLCGGSSRHNPWDTPPVEFLLIGTHRRFIKIR
jgi:hypothetical protein